MDFSKGLGQTVPYCIYIDVVGIVESLCIYLHVSAEVWQISLLRFPAG